MSTDRTPLPRVDLINLDNAEFEGLPFVLTSPRSLEACRRLGLEPVSLLAQSSDALRSRMSQIPEPALAAMAERLEVERRCRLRLARLERERIIDEEAAGPDASGKAEPSGSGRWNSATSVGLSVMAPSTPQPTQTAVNNTARSSGVSHSVNGRSFVVDASSELVAPIRKAGSDRSLNYSAQSARHNFTADDSPAERRIERRSIGGSEPQLDYLHRSIDAPELDCDDKPTKHRLVDRNGDRYDSPAPVHSLAMGGSEPQLFLRATGDPTSRLRRRDSGRRWERKRRNHKPAHFQALNGLATVTVASVKKPFVRAVAIEPNGCELSMPQWLPFKQPPTAMLQKMELMRQERFQASSDRRRRLEAEIDDFRQEMRRLRQLAERRTLDAAERGLRAMRAA